MKQSTHMSGLKRTMIAGAALLAIGAGVFAYTRTANNTALQKIDTSVELRPEFTVSDTQEGMTRYLSGDTQTDLNEAFLEKLDEALTYDDPIDRLRTSELLGTRARLLFAPDYDAWRSHVVAAAGEGALQTEDGTYMGMWEGSAQPYANPLVDVSGVRVVSIDPDRGFPETQPGTVCMRSDKQVRATYQPLEYDAGSGTDTRECIEVFVPVRIRDADGSNLGATISFVLGRSRATEPWRELEMFVYLGSDAMGREIKFPPF